jgi:hypothetical protein
VGKAGGAKEEAKFVCELDCTIMGTVVPIFDAVGCHDVADGAKNPLLPWLPLNACAAAVLGGNAGGVFCSDV